MGRHNITATWNEPWRVRNFWREPIRSPTSPSTWRSHFGARKGAPMTRETPQLLGWRDRMTARPAVRKVAGEMAAFLASIGYPVPDFLRGVR
jgi:hypothetical protein